VNPRKDSAPAKNPVGRGQAKPEASRKPNQRTTVEEVTDDEADGEYKRGPPRRGKTLFESRPAKGVRFADKEGEVGGTKRVKVPERPYVDVPPLSTAYKNGPLKPPLRVDEKDRDPLPSLEKRNPAFKRQAPIEEEESARRIMEELLNAKFTTSLKDLASISPQAREYLRKMITKRKVAVEPKSSDLEYQLLSLIDLMTNEKREQVVQMCVLLGDETEEPEEDRETEDYLDVNTLPAAQFFVAEGLEGVPDGSLIARDPVEQYLNSLEDGEDPRPIIVAKESVALRTVYPKINGPQKAEVLLDTGSQICSMDSDVARNLGLTWDPDIIINLQSANRTMEKTLGLARNVEFDFGGVTAYLQLHIIRRPAYQVLLGRPFDVTMTSEVTNKANGDQTITIRDPNTGKKMTLPTYPRGRPPMGVQKELQDFQERSFRASRI
jgi:hypothetical protein